MKASTYRYQLPQKAIKADCPDCGPRHRRTLSRYVDTRTGEPLPHIYGRCDRESNCGYHESPYTAGQSGLSYADEVFERWKQENPRATPHQQKPWNPKAYNKTKKRPISTSTQTSVTSSPSSIEHPVFCIPDEIFEQSLGHYDRNQLATLLCRRFGQSIASELLQRFQIGTSSRWPGACVFWYIDEKGRKRGGQIKLFGDDWHTVKYFNQDGKRMTKTSWVHSALIRRLEAQQLPVPEWLTTYEQHAERSPCLFGLPQLRNAPDHKPVAIVEAPKTAILCSAHFPEFIWLAVGALSYLNTNETGMARLMPVCSRKIVLFPDLSGDGSAYARWSRIADELGEKGFVVTVSDYLERTATDEQREAGLDLADFLLNQQPISKVDLPYLTMDGQTIYGEVLPVNSCDMYPSEWDEMSENAPPILVPSQNRALNDVIATCSMYPSHTVPLFKLAKLS
ncbi:DUF6371 domain-containing protein [Spirosoma rigui]|uniref:DUF6371 domain-containing protein n=1 Tax=Spirosoma rigui TaxID=564064 RepID=UPI0015D02C57|nr:DUF6371 domain-containing protein [Spirosoma rigui]